MVQIAPSYREGGRTFGIHFGPPKRSDMEEGNSFPLSVNKIKIDGRLVFNDGDIDRKRLSGS